MADDDPRPDPAARLREVLAELRVEVLHVEPGDTVVASVPAGYGLAQAKSLAEALGGAFPPGTRLAILADHVRLQVWRAGEPPPGLAVPHIETTELRGGRL
jgi:hypothetical protein